MPFLGDMLVPWRVPILCFYVQFQKGTLPETNIAPENGWLEY